MLHRPFPSHGDPTYIPFAANEIKDFKKKRPFCSFTYKILNSIIPDLFDMSSL